MGSVIPDGSRVLVDTVALIYFLERHERYSATAETVFRRIETGELQGLMSSLAFAELLVPLYRSDQEQTAIELARDLLAFDNLEIINLTPEISMQAAMLRARFGLRTPDAIHAATAIIGDASGILTNDRRLAVLRQTNLSVWLFSDLLENAPRNDRWS